MPNATATPTPPRAALLHLLGFDHERLTYRYSGRDFRLTDVSGKVIREVIAANPKQAEDFRAGKDKLLGFFVGQVMKATKGQGNRI